jgi:hypothetical protein
VDAGITEVASIDSRGSRDGMFLKTYCPVLETRDACSLEGHCWKRESEPARLGELFPLSELKSNNEQGQTACGRSVANPPDEAS